MKRNPQRLDSDQTLLDDGIRWFKLEAALTEFGSASARACKWNRTSKKWEIISTSGITTTVKVYSTVEKITGGSGDFVPCRYNATGKLWEVLRPGLSVRIGKTDAAIAKSASGVVSRYSGSTRADTGTNDTVYNLFANVAISKWVAYLNVDGTDYMIAAEC